MCCASSDPLTSHCTGLCCDRTDREVEYEEGLELANKYNIPFVEASAKMRVNVDELFIGMVRLIQHCSVPSTDRKQPGKGKFKKRFFGFLG